MTVLDAFAAALVCLVIGGGIALIVLGVAVLVRSRRATTVRLFGRALHRPRLWASAAVCGGVAALLFEARVVMPGSWQEPSRTIGAVLQLAFFASLFAHGVSQMLARRRQHS